MDLLIISHSLHVPYNMRVGCRKKNILPYFFLCKFVVDLRNNSGPMGN